MNGTHTSIAFIKYPPGFAWLGVFSMVAFRFALWFRRDIEFFRLMGCGKEGKFDFSPNWQQWAIVAVHSKFQMTDRNSSTTSLYGKFVAGWLSVFRCETRVFMLEALDGHGKWNGRNPFSFTKNILNQDDKIAILTRATIRFGKLRTFWKNASIFNHHLSNRKGILFSIGFGEMPFLKQATFSIWENLESMKSFAYQSEDHRNVIQRTRDEGWYSEELFVRFRVILDTLTG